MSVGICVVLLALPHGRSVRRSVDKKRRSVDIVGHVVQYLSVEIALARYGRLTVRYPFVNVPLGQYYRSVRRVVRRYECRTVAIIGRPVGALSAGKHAIGSVWPVGQSVLHPSVKVPFG